MQQIIEWISYTKSYFKKDHQNNINLELESNIPK